MNPTKTLYYLFLPAFLLPVFITFLVIFGRLFHGLGNLAASEVLQWTAFAAAMLWLTDIVGLLLLVALRAILNDDTSSPRISGNDATLHNNALSDANNSEKMSYGAGCREAGKTVPPKNASPLTESPDDEVVYF